MHPYKKLLEQNKESSPAVKHNLNKKATKYQTRPVSTSENANEVTKEEMKTELA